MTTTIPKAITLQEFLNLPVFQWSHIPFGAGGEVPDNFEMPPDWTIEILSPEQKPNKVIGNILHCLRNGCQLGWFIDPDDLSILVFSPKQQPELMQGGDRLSVLEGVELVLTVGQVFGWLKMDATR
ncbi:MAG: Uma2 family endonuclease [Microcystaceae cyanobacterium]